MTNTEVNHQANIEAKFIGNREGSSSRTPYELAEIFIGDVCHLLNIPEPELSEEEDGEFIHDMAREYDDKLSGAGYSVVWDDGFAIYKKLTEEESEYLYP